MWHKMITIGSLFSGIGGFELGLERAIPNSTTIWQVEQDKFCQSILKKHWPNSQIYDDICNVGRQNLKPVDIICGGFPCQDISCSGLKRGIYEGKKSGLWWEMYRVISELSQGPKKPIVVLENVSNITRLGGREVLGSLTELGYDSEWCIISAGGKHGFGAPHLRKRWFCVAYPTGGKHGREKCGVIRTKGKKAKGEITGDEFGDSSTKNGGREPSNANRNSRKEQPRDAIGLEQRQFYQQSNSEKRGLHKRNYWERYEAPSALCHVDDGIPNRLAKLKALGNAIVPQCSEYIGEYIQRSGIL